MKQYLTVLLLAISVSVFGQPVNDNCNGLITLGNAPVCQTGVLYSNVNATESNIGTHNFPPCFRTTPQRDVWFSFVAVAGITNYRISINGVANTNQGVAAMKNPQLAVYKGNCSMNGLQLLACNTSYNGESSVSLDMPGLTPGTYFLRVNDWATTGTNAGSFNVCVIQKPLSALINQGNSSACSGYICDSGGPNGNYSNNENFSYTICPTAPSTCINFTLDYYELETKNDILTFYDGPNINSPVIGQISGTGFTTQNGGVAYTVNAKSGCLTLQFKSNGNATFRGFCGTWQCSSQPCPNYSAIKVNTAIPVDEIVKNIAAGKTKVSVKSVNCPKGSAGIFTAGPGTDLGMEKGLILSTGEAKNAANPGSAFASTGNGFPGDPDLDAISRKSGSLEKSLDACVVELEVFAATDELTFEYIFGSEEYPEFVETHFNDLFAFLVSGPGITGDPDLGNKFNIATLPDGTPIQINSVNQKNNWEYYRNNEEGKSIVFDGLTSDYLGKKKSLTARVKTIPCNTYQLKLAIGDRLDDQYDSGVLISDIKGGSPNISIAFKNGVDYISETCSVIPDEITVSLNHTVTEPVSYRVKLGGTAIFGIDYQLTIPEFLTFTPAQPSFTWPITGIADALNEGRETILVQLTKDYGCGDMTLGELKIVIDDAIDVEILNAPKDTLLVCKNGCLQLEATGATHYAWTPVSVFANPFIPNPTACPPFSQWVYVTGISGICSDRDSVYLRVVEPQLEIIPGTLTACQGDTVKLTAKNNVGDLQIRWISTDVNLADPTKASIQFPVNTAPATLALIAALEVGSCSVFDTIAVNVEGFEFPKLAKDTTICQNYSVILGENINSTSTKYSWTPATGLSSSTVSGPLATPDATTTYRLIGVSTGGNCRDTGFVKVDVIPADVNILGRDTIFLCVGDTVGLRATTTTNGVGLTWIPKTSMIQVRADSVRVFPKVSTWYFAILETANCKVVDSVLVYVDSIPDLRIKAAPAKSAYCQGEEVYLTSPTYEPASHRNIKIEWIQPLPGAQTPDSFLNLVFYATETAVYKRTTTINACKSTDSIAIKVILPNQLTVLPDTTICQGGSVKFRVTAPPGTKDYKWEPVTGLSCTECKEPVATLMQSATYNVKAELEGCPVNGSITVPVTPLPLFQFPSVTTICPGQQILLNEFNDPTSTYTWTASDGSLNSTSPRPLVSPTRTTTYTLNAVNKNCPISAQLTINVPQDFTLPAIADTAICRGQTAKLTARPSKTGVTYTWRNENGVLLSTLPDLTIIPNATARYFLTVQDQNPTCFIKRDTVVITVNPLPTITSKVVKEVGNDTLDIYEGEQYNLNVNVLSGSAPGATYEWFLFGQSLGKTQTGAFGPQTAPDVEADQVLSYGVLITNQFGCQVFDTIRVVIKDNPVRIPTVFTPNDDLINNTFKLISKNPVTIVEFKVWNRWGQLVYNNENGLEGWDGYFKGSPAASDVYVFYVKYKIPGTNQPERVLRGDVTLLR